MRHGNFEMSDLVQHALEAMTDDLSDWVARDIFSKKDVRSIVRKRRGHELLLAKRPPVVGDFLRAISYEVKLDTLFSARLKMVQERTTEDIQTSSSDFSVRRRIHWLWNRALQAFSSQEWLWDQYLRFCEVVNSNHHASNALAKYVELHPNKSSTWTKAAAWQYGQRNNAHAARVLLQRGIRNIPSSKTLWAALFRLELVELQATGDAHLKLNESCALLQKVLEFAIESLSDSPALRIEFASMVTKDGSIFRARVLDSLYHELIRDFPNHPEAISAVAFHIGWESGCQLFIESTLANPTTAVRDAFAEFACFHACHNQSGALVELEFLYASAVETSTQTEALYLAYSRALCSDKSQAVLVDGLKNPHISRSDKLWEMYLGTSADRDAVELFSETLSGGTGFITLSTIDHLMNIAIASCTPHCVKALFDNILSTFGTEGVSPILTNREYIIFKQNYVNWVALSVTDTRLICSACDSILSSEPLSPQVYLKCISLVAYLQDEDATRKQYEAAVHRFGTNSWQLWYSFAAWEKSICQFPKSELVFFRASKTLTESKDLAEMHRAMAC